MHAGKIECREKPPPGGGEEHSEQDPRRNHTLYDSINHHYIYVNKNQ